MNGISVGIKENLEELKNTESRHSERVKSSRFITNNTISSGLTPLDISNTP